MQNIEIPALTAEEKFDEQYLNMLKARPNRFLQRSAGDPRVGVSTAPRELVTTVWTFYQQGSRDYCLPYSFASGLRYCGFEDAATEIASYEGLFSYFPTDWALDVLENMMLSLAPLIGRARKFNIKGKKKMSVKELLEDETPYPTLVIPRGKNGYCGHCICVVDNLIFDPITPFALRLNQDSLTWIFGVEVTKLHFVYHFMIKESPEGI